MTDPASSSASERDAQHADLIAAARRQHEGAEAAEAAETPRPQAGNPSPPDYAAASPPGAAADSVTLTSPDPAFSQPPPDSFAGYQLLREIHRGGQGVVYQAFQKSTQRKVAIKVMREGPFAGASDKARFDLEVQILGQLQHPNIVTIYDTGVAAGCHYFVMDYISGQPLDVYMAGAAEKQGTGTRERGVQSSALRQGRPGLSIESTLRLFAKICEAVNAAHLRGVIHRDLKPGNIRIDNDGQPHILDFGLAKVATPLAGGMPAGRREGGHREGGRWEGEAPAEPLALMTMTGQFIGSLPWASPEQAEGQPGKMDIRTDVYSLGVILYQMLTSRFPYEVIGNMRDVLDRIMHAEPVRPRVASASGRQLNDEVETIVLKCLSKERERRYQSAGELSRDIGRYLAGEPIEAKRDSGWYVLRKMVRRHRTPVIFAAVVLFLILDAWIGMWIMYGHIKHERDRADVAAQTERGLREQADEQRALAEQREHEALAARESERAATEAALGAKAEADKARETTEYQSYVANVEMAAAALDFRQFDRVRARLDACPRRLRGWEWLWLDSATDNSLLVIPLTIRSGYIDVPDEVSFSLDGTQLVAVFHGTSISELLSETPSSQGITRAWDSVTGASVDSEEGSAGKRSASSSPDGTRTVSRGPGHCVVLRDAATGANLAELKGHTDFVTSVLFSHDRTRVVTASFDKTARVWDAATGASLFELVGHTGPVDSASFSPDGTRIVTTSEDSTVRVWDTATGASLVELKGHIIYVNSGSFSPDGTRLVTASSDIRVWDAATGANPMILKGYLGPALSASYSADERRILMGLKDNTAPLLFASFSQDGKQIVTASLNTARVWDASTGESLAELNGHAASLNSASLSPDGTRVVTASEDGTAGLWDAASGASLAQLRGHTAPVLSASFSQDGKQIVTASLDNTARVWDAATGASLTELNGYTGPVHSAAFSPDGTRIITASDHGTVRVWDAATGASLAELNGHTARLNTVSFSPDGTRIVTASRDKTVRVWDVATSASLVELELNCLDHQADLCQASFSPRGTQLIIVRGSTARISDAATGASLAELMGHTKAVLSATFSPDETRIVTASYDGTARIWDAATGVSLAELKGHTGVVYCALFSPDGRRIATASDDGTVRIWDSVPWRERFKELQARGLRK